MQLRLPFVAAFLALVLAAPAWSAAPGPDEAGQIRAVLDGADASPSPGDADLHRFYALRGYAPAWDDPAAVAALAAALTGAAGHGLSYAMPDAANSGAERDMALSRVALAYATALARGRVEPETFEADWGIPLPAFDAAAGLQHALTRDLAGWYVSLAPHHPAYEHLVAALAHYRSAAGWAPIPRGEPLKLGMVDERVRALRKRLEAEGDLAPLAVPEPQPSAPVVAEGPIQRVAAVASGADAAAAPDAALAADPAAHYDEAVEAAVRRFQRRYGIAVDGAMGPRTLAAMNVPLRARVEQIALNLERWRTLPHDLGTSYMLVNVPAETLNVVRDGETVIEMKVVVGDVEHPTPVVRTAIQALTVNPTWNIPASIAANEIVPKSKRDPSYLRKNEIVFAPGHGWQQLPGPKNPLGQLKFETPNQFDVYLHDTPSRLAFDRFFRAQSHGCVRLESAPELAGFVLGDQGWNELQIAQAAASGQTQRIDVKRHWRVWLLYATSFVDEDGTVEFRDDFYGRDARLRDALAGRHPADKQARL